MWVRRCAFLLLIAAHSGYTAVNRTIDDSDTTITYLPSGQWSERGSCSDCTASPDSSRAQGGGWHSATYRADDGAPPSIEVQFTGTGVFLYNILANPSSGSTAADTHLQFYWDGTYDKGSDFDWESAWGSSGGADFQYHQLVYYITGLEQGQHIVRVQPKVDRDSLILFDYAEYTADHFPSVSNTEPVSNPTRSSSVANPEPVSNPTGTLSPVGSSTASPATSATPSPSGIPNASPPTTKLASEDRSPPSESNRLPTPTGSAAAAQSSTNQFSIVSGASLTTSSPSTWASSPVGAHSHDVSVGIIAGATVGGVAALTVLVLLAVNYVRKRSPRGTSRDEKPVRSSASGEKFEGDDGVPVPRLPAEPYSRSGALLIGSASHGRSSSSRCLSTESALDVHLAATIPAAIASGFQMPAQGASDSTEVRHEEKLSSSPATLRQVEVEVERDLASHPSALPDHDAGEGDAGEPIARRLSPDGDSMQVQLAALREEVARLRDHFDAPPRYE
ncbi:hypothetical protein C8Q74DRAFT_420862 [Fomes fomentarius]|nr:hypothetical protein C8Q74DRAFT_420862 [Fomes fomentarius]